MLIASYILVYISAMILRKKIPAEEYKFKIPGGFGLLVVLCIVPICVALFAIFINGSDYYHRRHDGDGNRSVPLHHLEKDVRRSHEERPCRIPVKSRGPVWQ